MNSTDLLSQKLEEFRADKTSNPFAIRNVRDLVITELTNTVWMVTACDSDGGIGPKPLDTFHTSAYELGRFGMRVPLMEIIASGAEPFITADLLTVEMDPTGKEIIRGIRDELDDAGVNGNTAVTGSTEDNVKTVQTGMGVVIMGLVHKNDFRPGKSLPGDIVAAVGIPKSAPEYKVEYNDTEIANPATVRELLALEFIHEILPVGSKGIQHESAELAKVSGLSFSYNKNPDISINKSGGPSACCLVSLSADNFNNLKDKIKKPVFLIGELREK
jgi:hypothetical protein